MNIVARLFKKIMVLSALIIALIVLYVPSHFFSSISDLVLECGYSYPTSIISSPLGAFCDVDATVVNSDQNTDDNEISMIHDYMLQIKFEQALIRFKHAKDYGETSLQNLIDLLGYDLKLVHLLFYGNTGAVIDSVLEARDIRLESTIPSVVFIYRAIIDLVTYDSYFNPILFKQYTDNKRLAFALNHDKKRAFLLEMETKLMQYQNSMRQLQHEIALGSSIDTDISEINSCGSLIPKIK